MYQIAQDLRTKQLFYQMEQTFYKFFNNSDAEISVLNELEYFNKIAFIHDDAQIRQWELILKHKNVRKISVGENVLRQNCIGYSFSGWVPTFLQKRIGGLMWSGILEWWNNFVSVHVVKIRTSKKLFGRNKNYEEFFRTKSINNGDSKTRCFFFVFYLVLQVGLQSVLCLVVEICAAKAKQIEYFIMQKISILCLYYSRIVIG